MASKFSPNKPITVEAGIPLPPQSGIAIYPWRTMNVGDSFLVRDKLPYIMHLQAAGAGKRTGYRFSCRQVKNGIRIWRVQ